MARYKLYIVRYYGMFIRQDMRERMNANKQTDKQTNKNYIDTVVSSKKLSVDGHV